MAVVAITGKLNSGKTTVLKLLKKKGAVTFNIDERIHQLYSNKKSIIYKKIAFFFPEAIRGGGICRKKLANLVFSDIDKRRLLENIVHPLAIKELRRWVGQAAKKNGLFVAEVPLLFEKGLQDYFDYTILVTARQEVLLERVIKRHKLSRSDALRRLRVFLPTQGKRKMVDFVVDNSYDIKQLQKEVEVLWRKLKQKQRPIKEKC